ncbi:mechanosensitive ion channel family protein [Tengunoibacter tsumagoiensis]|uniref:Small-conductance mechanosensitive ion channel n=1 Tax=Tengunoibacter tsumagoiensis TaxID=2014871 RepID=A0A401ZXE8_9CHLR|nr:small-conductance mechanosensitive ion channel [Tengunoibacter tsumagoiensis]GCE11524.1 hypothetical protein KTT_13830 [Tengunoibacter tsumagoiensis]
MSTVTDWGSAIVSSFAAALALLFAFVPKLLGFLVILLIGWLVASALAKAVTFLLRKVGFDRISSRIGLTRFEQQMGLRMDAPDLLGKIVYWFVFLVFLVPAVDALGLTSVSSLLDKVISYIPNLFIAIIILFVGGLLAKLAADIVRGAAASGRFGNPNLFANITRYVILGFIALLALYQLQIAPAMIQTLFTAILGGAALAFGLAFGLGGRDSAKRYLDRSEAALSGGSSESYTTPLQTNQESGYPRSGHMTNQYQMQQTPPPFSNDMQQDRPS